MKKKANTIKTIVVVLIMALLVVGYYVAISSRGQASDKENKKETLSGDVKDEDEDKLLGRNLEKDYPLTPTAVLAYYSDLVLAYYDDDCTDAKRKKLMEQSRKLYDEELLEVNKEDDQWVNLSLDIDAYKEKKKQIINYEVCRPGEVEYGDLNGAKVALAVVTYRLRVKDDLGDLKEEFFLRRDEEGLWKIVGWQLPKS